MASTSRVNTFSRRWFDLRRRDRYRPFVPLLLVAFLAAALGSALWLAYRAIAEWRRSTEMLVEQRSQQALMLLSVALNNDMMGVQNSVLSQLTERTPAQGRPHDLARLFAHAFARFPYADSFFVWTDQPSPKGTTRVFNRADRPPAWDDAPTTGALYSVREMTDAPALADVISAVRKESEQGRRLGMLETVIAGTPYQVITSMMYGPDANATASSIVGFTVDLTWIRQHYYPELLRQIARIGGGQSTLSLAIIDDQGVVVSRTGASVDQADLSKTRKFPVLFLNPGLVSDLTPLFPRVREWTIRISPSDDPSLVTAAGGVARVFAVVLVSAAAATLGLVLSIGALKSNADVANMKSEFVSSVTHELKTPLAAISLVAETLGAGRFSSNETVIEFARVMTREASRLTRLINNLLTYASISDVKQFYHFEQLSVTDLIDSALESFDARLTATGIDPSVSVSPDLPPIRGDRPSLLQVLDNVLDNAIKYAGDAGAIAITALAESDNVVLRIVDQGPGIKERDLEKVLLKFYRGKDGRVAGSGLGLAIADRVLKDHGGRIRLRSGEGKGTTVEMVLPAVQS